MEQALPVYVTPEMLEKAKTERTNVKLAELFDDNGNYVESIIVQRPTAFVFTQFEKIIDKEPYKAKKMLIKDCVVGEERAKQISSLSNDNPLFNAAFAACSEILPIGKAVVKNL